MTNINDYLLSLEQKEDGSQEFRIENPNSKKLFHGIVVDGRVTKICNCNILYGDLLEMQKLLNAILITM